MRWVTGESVLAGRMLQGWLIRRFVDPGAEFLYAPNEKDLTAFDATPFMVPGHPLAQRDELVAHYKLLDKHPLLRPMLEIFVPAREAYIAMRDEGAPLQRAVGANTPPETAGLAMILYGIGLDVTDAAQRMRRGCEAFDALYAALATQSRAGVPAATGDARR